MKTIHSFMMLAMIVAALNFTACGGDSDDEIDNGGGNASIVGLWECTSNPNDKIILVGDKLCFMSNGKFRLEFPEGGIYVGKWTKKGEKLILSDNSSQNISFTITKLNSMIMELDTGIKLKRISGEESFESLEGNRIFMFTVNRVSFKMIRVDGGTFTMGDDYWKPAHQVTLSSYYIGETEVTQELWKAVMGSNPSYFSGSRKPVENVSWEDCIAFIIALNSATGSSFRLPTEAEWEFAARGGNQSRGYKFSGSNTIDNVAWCSSNSNGQTHDVATKAANELGLYDMSGNVQEWCNDWYDRMYSSLSQTNPTGPTIGDFRVFRGGNWHDDDNNCCVSDRGNYTPWSHYFVIGLRLAHKDTAL